MTSTTIDHVPANKGRKLPPEPLTAQEVKALLRACSTRAATGVRNRALDRRAVPGRLADQRSAGPAAQRPGRPGQRHDPRLARQGRPRPRCRAWTLAPGPSCNFGWIVAPLPASTAVPRVFCTLKGRPMKSAYVRTLLPRLARKAGIDKRCHAHGLRHTHAYELATEGTPIHVIQAQLGHSSVATTDRYIKHLNPAAVVKTMQSRAWTL